MKNAYISLFPGLSMRSEMVWIWTGMEAYLCYSFPYI